jgi:NADPH:quinone reductase-like Zn-dependent oxidoreductase
MRAVVADRYGPPEVLRLEEVERPVPRDDEILVRVRATTVNRSDCGVRGGDPFVARFVTGLRRPRWRILGSELAGEVEAVGAAVREFRVGDRVFGVNPWKLGAQAEFVCVREGAPVATMPAGLGFAEAAPVCDGAILVLNCLRPARLRGGKRMLVYGASGSIGAAGVQLARRRLRRGRQAVVPAPSRLSAAGRRVPRHRRLGEPGARAPDPADPTQASRLPDPAALQQDVLFLESLIETGKYRPVIDRRYGLEQVVEATRYVETERKLGNVVFTVGHDGD